MLVNYPERPAISCGDMHQSFTDALVITICQISAFLLLVTISIVWYVFFAFNILFFFDGGRAPVSEDLDLPWCPAMYFTYCLFTL